jgi:hypothetical protein
MGVLLLAALLCATVLGASSQPGMIMQVYFVLYTQWSHRYSLYSHLS